MKSLKAQHSQLASEPYQLLILEETGVPKFRDKLATFGMHPLQPGRIEVFQMNVGKMCNQTCKHCHVDAGPDRQEIMTRDTMEACLEVLALHDISTVDITGGAPEMNPNFRWLVEQCVRLGKKVMVRCNLTIVVANKKYHYLPAFYADNGIEVVSSLPFYNADRTDRQRGKGVFEASVAALRMLNEQGYGDVNGSLKLNLVYNPTGAFLPASQRTLEDQFRKVLWEEFGVRFNQLYAITNMPISRFLDFLIQSGNYGSYMERLVQAFNPVAAAGVMCRNTISVGWDGFLYDCDFNQMLDLKLADANRQHVTAFDLAYLETREIILSQHCYGCTAGSGSSCGGEVTKQ